MIVSKLYLSGPMRGYPDMNYPTFREAAQKLRWCGYDVIDPGAKGTINGWEWEDYLRVDLIEMLSCQAVATLQGWHLSEGANLEIHVANKLKMPVFPVEHWVAQRSSLVL